MEIAPDGESRALIARLLQEQIDGAAGEALDRWARAGGAPGASAPRRDAAPRSPYDYDPVLDDAAKFARGLQGSLAAEAESARAAWRDLALQPQARRQLLVAHRPRYQTWGLLNLLLETAGRVAVEDPREACRLAQLAVELLDHLRHPCLSAGGKEDLRAAALRSLAGAQLLAGEVARAGRTLGGAWAAFERGTGDLLERAHLLALRSRVRAAAGNAAGAVRSIAHARRLYGRLKERGLEGRALLAHAGLAGHREPRLGIDLLRSALERIDAEADPRVALDARHLLVWFTNDAGRPCEARRLAGELRPLYRRFPDANVGVRRRWLEGRILRDLGVPGEAEALLLAALLALADLGAVEDLILCGLDLLELCGQAGWGGRIADLDLSIRRVLTGWGARREALAAWARAVEGSADPCVVREVGLLFRERSRQMIPPLDRGY